MDTLIDKKKRTHDRTGSGVFQEKNVKKSIGYINFDISGDPQCD
jgi:hypothetical protein